MTEYAFELFADFHQFLVRDSQAEWADLPEQWTGEAIASMFVQGTGYVGVGTARDTVVPVRVRVHSLEPSLDPAHWDRVVMGTIDIPSGELVISGVTDNEMTGGRIEVAPGTYCLRVLYENLNSISSDGLSGNDRYSLELWPAPR